MFDLHTHILPGIDDGAQSVEDSLLMLQDSFSQGVRVCALTPHCIIHKKEDIDKFLSNREKSFAELRKALVGNENCPKLLLGAEIYFDNDINSYEGIEKLCLEGTDYIMLEFPVDRFNPLWAEWIYNLNRKGIKVLVAHVDRYMHWEKMIDDFKGLDVEYQVNASRFISFSDRKLVKRLVEKGYRYIVSSDMHNMKARKCNMRQSYEKAMKKYPEKAVDFFMNNAARITKIRHE